MDYFGRVERLLGTSRSAFGPQPFLPATHKISLHKKILNHEEKKNRDHRLCLRLLRPGYPLLSQDERVKQGMVPSSFNLDLKRLAGSDIVAGQNINVFLTLGPGVNYFDDPCLASRRNIPSPRFVYHPSIYFIF